MPKKPRKIRIGGRIWNEQKEKDTAAWQEQKAAEDADPYAKARKAKEQAKKEREEAKRRAWERDERARAHEERRQEQEERRQEQEEQRQRQWEGQGSKPLMTFERREYLRVLGLTVDQDNTAAINKAYKIMALKYHPDRNGLTSALAMMQRVNNAHDFLTK